LSTKRPLGLAVADPAMNAPKADSTASVIPSRKLFLIFYLLLD
jgi:hypothetical protein